MTANPSGCSVLRTCSAAVLRAAAPGRCLTFSDSFLERQKNARFSGNTLYYDVSSPPILEKGE
jgi:hypothetical protein